MNDLRNTYCSNLFKDSKATCEGQLRVMDSGRPSHPRLPQAQGLPWLNQPSPGRDPPFRTLKLFHVGNRNPQVSPNDGSLHPRLNQFQ